MIWTIWALLLIAHGAFRRWAKTASRHAVMSTLGDTLLVAIALFTLNQLQGLGAADFVRVGIFFIAFGVAGRQLMTSFLRPASLTRRR
jgi:hypothetical protein